MGAHAFNWVSQQGGLPPAIHRLAKKLERKGHDQSSAIAIAVAAAKRFAPQHPAWAAAVAEWEKKRAAAHGIPHDFPHFDFDPSEPRDPHGRWVQSLRPGARVAIVDGTDAETGEAVPGRVHGPVARSRGQTVMVNAGTPQRPRWVYGSGQQVQPHARRKPTDVRQLLDQPRDLFTADQVAAIRDYTGGNGSVAEELNRSLRRSTGSRHPEVRDRLDAAFARAKPLPRDGVVFRGTKIKGARGLEPGTVVEDRGFMSTSPSRSQAEDFVAYSGGDLFEIVLPEGTRALDVNEAAGSRFGKEREVLLPRGIRMVIESVGPHPSRPGRRVFRARVLR